MGIGGGARSLLFALTLVASSCSSTDDTSRSRDDAASEKGPSTTLRSRPEVSAAEGLEPRECPESVFVEAPATITCFEASVPERHGVTGGPTVTLPVAVIEPPGGATAPDPVVYLDGGPGGAGVTVAESFSTFAANGTRAVVIVGQRGSPLADPSFDCPEVEAVIVDTYDDAIDPAQVGASEAALAACHQRVAATSPSFETFDSATAADDLEAVRLRFGYDRWNLYGISYGTRLGLEVLRRHPEAVRSAVLDSAYPPDVQPLTEGVPSAERAFRQLSDGCDADSGCAAAYPDLYRRIGALYDQLEADPVDATVPHPKTGAPTTVRWDGDRTVQAAFQALYLAEIIPLLPFLLASFESGSFDLATTTYLDYVARAGAGSAEGLYSAVECRERVPFDDPAEVRRQIAEEPAWLVSAAGIERDFGMCEFWPAPAATAETQDPVATEVPLLVMAGAFDPVTPPEWGRRVADLAERAWFHEFPGYGHGPSSEACGAEFVLAFLDDPATDPAPPCAANLGPPKWVLP